MNEDELVANLFRINQTKQKLLKDNVQGEKEAKDIQKNPSKYESFNNVEELINNLKEDK